MKVSAAFLQRCASDTGFHPSAVEKVIRLGSLAGEIGRHPLLGEVLLLKGGTPLNLGFGPPVRLSVDLDFNFVGAVKREEMLAERPRVEKALEDLCLRLGYRVQHSADAFAGRAYYLSYHSATGGADRIEVDVNFLFRRPIGTPNSLELWQPGELDRPRVRTVSNQELFIGKLLALLNRTAPRDAWDVGHLAETGPDVLGSSIFRSRLITLSAVLDHPIHSYDTDRLARRITDRSVSTNLWPMLAHGKQPRRAELLNRARTVVEPYTRLSEAEAEFVQGIARGDLKPELLQLDDGSAAELAEHPAVHWKLQNVRSLFER